MRFDLALHHDPDPSNKQARQDLYTKKREMLLKLAVKTEMQRKKDI